MTNTQQLMNGDGCIIEVTGGGACLMRHTLETLVLTAARADNGGEVMRYSYQPSFNDDPEAPPLPRRYARLIVEELDAAPETP